MTATIKSITKKDGKVEVAWADGFTQYFSSVEDLRERFQEITSRDNLRTLLLAWLVARDVNLTNVSTAANKTLTFDLTLANPFKVQ